MKKATIRLLLAFIPLLICGCGGGSPAPIVPPISSAQMEAFLKFFLGDFQEEADLTLDFADCQEVHDLIDPNLGNPLMFDCDQGGKYTVTINSVDCDDGPPLSIVGKVSISYESCMIEGGLTLNGNESVDENREGTLFELTDTAMGLMVNDFIFDIDVSFTATQGQQGTCSGNIIVDGVSCEVSADCKTCAFE